MTTNTNANTSTNHTEKPCITINKAQLISLRFEDRPDAPNVEIDVLKLYDKAASFAAADWQEQWGQWVSEQLGFDKPLEPSEVQVLWDHVSGIRDALLADSKKKVETLVCSLCSTEVPPVTISPSLN